MKIFTIKSRNHGTVEFFIPGNRTATMKVSFDGCRPQTCCHGGGVRGDTVVTDGESLERDARTWWKAFLKWNRETH